MRIAVPVINELVDQLGLRLSGGTFRIFGDPKPDVPLGPIPTLREPLVEFVLRVPAFEPAQDGEAEVLKIADVNAKETGKGTWARLSDAQGNVVADLTFSAKAGTDVIAPDGDDFHRGGTVKCPQFVLTLPTNA